MVCLQVQLATLDPAMNFIFVLRGRSGCLGKRFRQVKL